MEISNDETLSRISAQALFAAGELKDDGDGLEKIAVLEKNTKDLVKLLYLWAATANKPKEGTLNHDLFCILADARSHVNLSKLNKLKTARLMIKALKLKDPHNGQRREQAVKFFYFVGCKVGERREKFLPKP